MIYFDHNATTPVDEQVLEAMLPFYKTFYGNASSLHRIGRLSRGAVETARAQVAALVGVSPSQVILTSGGTEANNLAIRGSGGSLPRGSIAVGATEHPSVLEPLAALVNKGWRSNTLRVDDDGLIDPASIATITDPDLRFASVMLANNETGVVQDVATLADRFREQGILIHCDAVQGVGKIPVKFDTLKVNLLSLSGHKIYGPKGVGALIVDKSVALQPVLYGGGQERGLRGGTENVAAIVGIGKAAELALSGWDEAAKHLMKLRRRLECGLDALAPVRIFARDAVRLPNTVQFGIKGFDGEMIVMELDRRGVAVSSGSACSSEGNEPSHVLLAMGITPDLARSAVRISLGKQNTATDIDNFLEVLQRIIPAGGRRMQA